MSARFPHHSEFGETAGEFRSPRRRSADAGICRRAPVGDR